MAPDWALLALNVVPLFHLIPDSVLNVPFFAVPVDLERGSTKLKQHIKQSIVLDVVYQTVRVDDFALLVVPG